MTPSAALTGKILIADDNRVNQLLLGRGLEQQGHSVVFAGHGREALDLLRNDHFDLMLLDVMMPELDGYEVLAELKVDPHLREIPVIMTSSLDEVDSVVKCVEMGAEDYLNKPINPVLLNARISASLEKKRLRDQQRELISKFATKEVADDLLTSGFSLGGKQLDASAMFCDTMRGAPRVALVLAVAAAIAYVDGLGIHLSANDVGHYNRITGERRRCAISGTSLRSHRVAPRIPRHARRALALADERRGRLDRPGRVAALLLG